MRRLWNCDAAPRTGINVRSVDIHTHILPETWPDFAKKFGYGTEKFLRIEHQDSCCARLFKGDTFFRAIESNCWDSGTRIAECDEHGINVQVLSTVPVMFSYWARAEHTHEIAQFLNDDLAATVQAHPNRFIGLGTVPMQDPERACVELERCIKELGFAGVQIGTNVNQKNLSDPLFYPFFEHAAALGAAIFVHPWDIMGAESMERYWLPWLVGMPAETSRAICSFIFGGLFERLPSLRVAFAHGGGSFPSTVGRIEHGYNVRPDLCAIDNQVNPRSYLGKFYLDSLVHDSDVLVSLIKLIGHDKIALGTDYPFPLGELQPGQLIHSLPDVADDVKARLLSGTALEWLGLPDFTF